MPQNWHSNNDLHLPMAYDQFSESNTVAGPIAHQKWVVAAVDKAKFARYPPIN